MSDSNTLKARYFLNGLIDQGSAYFFDDGFPKNPSIAVAASGCLNVIEKLERELSTANARISELTQELEDESNLKALAYSRHAAESGPDRNTHAQIANYQLEKEKQ